MKSTPVLEGSFHDSGGPADDVNILWDYFSDYPCGKSRSREWNTLKHLFGESEGFAHNADSVLSQLNQRFDDSVTECFIGIDSQLRKDIMLAFDSCHRLIHIG